LFYSGDTVLITDSGMQRLTPMIPAGIVTHCLIKAKDAAALDAVRERLAEGYGHLDAADVLDTGQIKSAVTEVNTVIMISSAIAVISCVLALWVLLKLSFQRDRKNFRLLRMLGMSELKITAITALTGLLMCMIALPAAHAAARLFFYGFGQASVLLADINVGALPYLIGSGGAFIIGMLAAVAGGKGRESAKEKNKRPVPDRTALLFLSGAAVCCAAAVLVMRAAPPVGFVLAAAAFIGFLFSVPRISASAYAAIHGKVKNIYSLRLKTLSGSGSFQKFAVFFMVSSLVILTLFTGVANIRDGVEKQISNPFAAAVTEIKRPGDALFQRVADAEGVDDAVRSSLNFNIALEVGDKAVYGNLIGMEEKGFAYFGADFSLTRDFGGSGAIAGKHFADDRRLEIGDAFSFLRGGEEITLTLAGIVETDYMGGRFVLADLTYVATPAHSYSDILIAASGSAEEVIYSVNRAAGGEVSVVSLSSMGDYLVRQYAGFLWILDLFSISVTVLIAVTAVFMTALRRFASREELSRLRPLGLTAAAEVRQNFFAALCRLACKNTAEQPRAYN
jgi:hypothetical protein